MPRSPDVSPLVGCEVVRVSLDDQVRLLLLDSDAQGVERVSAELVIGVPFDLVLGDAVRRVDPDTGDGYPDVPHLLRRSVQHAYVRPDLALVLDLDRGTGVRVPRDPRYESWELSGRGVASWLTGPT